MHYEAYADNSGYIRVYILNGDNVVYGYGYSGNLSPKDAGKDWRILLKHGYDPDTWNQDVSREEVQEWYRDDSASSTMIADSTLVDSYPMGVMVTDGGAAEHDFATTALAGMEA